MKLGFYASPFVRKGGIDLAEKRIEYDFVFDHRATWSVSDFNPLGKVPVLVTDDGASICDSSVIVEYLDTISPIGTRESCASGRPSRPRSRGTRPAA